MSEHILRPDLEKIGKQFDGLISAVNSDWVSASEDKVKQISDRSELVSEHESQRTSRDRIALIGKYQSGELKFPDNDPRKELWELCQKFEQLPQADTEIVSKNTLSEPQQNAFQSYIDSLRKLRTKYEWPWDTFRSLSVFDHDVRARSDREVDLRYIRGIEDCILETDSSATDLSLLTENQFRAVRNKYKISHIIFDPSSSSECSVIVDSQYLYTALDNLVGNSIKYSGKNLTDLTVFEWVGISEDEKARIIYADNGNGFDPKMLERVDGKARALKKGETTKGTGLGLWLVDNIVSEMGGQVSLLNAKDLGIEGLGAVTVIDFPIIQDIPQHNK